jgi:hypothetical protein
MRTNSQRTDKVMEQTILEIDHIAPTLMSIEPDAAPYDVPLVADAQPRIYTALTERPADSEVYFGLARHQHLDAVVTYRPTYKALTERPADFVDFFVPPCPKSTEGVATYTALKRHPDAQLSNIAA